MHTQRNPVAGDSVKTHHLIPKAFPDETLYGIVSRFGWLNGLADQDACEFLFGRQNRPLVSDVLADLEHFCMATEYAYGGPNEVVSTLTLWPFFLNMATHPAIETPVSGLVSAKRPPSEFGLAGLSNSQPHVWRMCRDCITQDLKTFGVAYWHRTHQLPGVAACLVHGQQLHEVRIPYWARQKHFLEPEALHAYLDESSSHGSHDCTHAVLETARFAERALSARDLKMTPAAIQGVVLDALRLWGLTNRGGVINAKEFAAQFVTHHAELAGCNHFSACLNTKALSRLAKALSNSPTMIPPTLSVLIGTWLFGSWERFRAQCQWRATIDAPALHLPPKVAGRSSERNRKEHRQTCLQFKASAPAASRTDFWHAHPKACRWLSQYDSEWLESKLPIAKEHAPKQLTLF